MDLLNLSEAPKDPVRRAAWLSGVMKQARTEMENALAATYYEARLQGIFPQAVEAGPYARNRALALTRRVNRERGRMVRWNDGLDATSTAYDSTTS